jgi:hypothetical protein
MHGEHNNTNLFELIRIHSSTFESIRVVSKLLERIQYYPNRFDLTRTDNYSIYLI